MGTPTMVEYRDEKLRATELARRLGVSPSCIVKRWLRGERGEQFVAPSSRAHKNPPRTREEAFAMQDAAKMRLAAETVAARSRRLRQRAKDEATKLAREHAAAFSRPLIDAKLLTKAERQAIAVKVRGTQRWNSAWFGDSRDSREAR